MALPKSAFIRVHNAESEWRFDWSGFDADDCFESFRLTITDRGVTRQFNFGSAVVWSLRWLNRFFADQKQEKTRGGLCVCRSSRDYRMTFEYDKKPQEFRLTNPEV